MTFAVGKRLEHFGIDRPQTRGVPHDDFPFCRQHQFARPAVKDLDVQLFFEHADMSAYRRLGERELRGGAGEIFFLRDRQKRCEFDIQHKDTSITKIYPMQNKYNLTLCINSVS